MTKDVHYDLFRVFPACAGVILSSIKLTDENMSLSRICGGDPVGGYYVRYSV